MRKLRRSCAVCAINESQFRKRRFTISSNWSQPKHHRQQRGVGREKDTLVAAWLPSIFSRADFNHAGRSTFCVAECRACRLCLGNVDSSRNCSVSRCECLANTRRHFSARARIRVFNQTHTTHLEDSRSEPRSVEAQRTRKIFFLVFPSRVLSITPPVTCRLGGSSR